MNMPKNLPVFNKAARIAVPLLLLKGVFLFSQEGPDFPARVSGRETWYRSNASGMALEEIPSRQAALRNEYALSVSSAHAGQIPDSLRDLYDPAYSVETRVLFEKGGELRRQWIFRDQRGTARLNASGSGGFFGGGVEEGGAKAGFVEIFDSDRRITEERRFEGSGPETVLRFFYAGGSLVKTESWEKAPPPEEPADMEGDTVFGGGGPVLILTDYYRYTRFNSLRAIERVYHSNGISGGTVPVRTAFPGITEGFSFGIETPVSGTFYDSEFFEDIASPAGTARSVFAADSRGRILSEQRLDEEGNVTGEIVNTWTGDRLASVEWKADDDERITEYEYDAEGNRIVERNYRNGVLERVVRSEGEGREIEELYMNGEVILRAVWENSRKVSEEQVRRRR
jgi:YD repeat-containing protein